MASTWPKDDEQRLLGCILTGHTHFMQSHVAITVICDDHVRSQLFQTSLRKLDPYLPHTLQAPSADRAQ